MTAAAAVAWWRRHRWALALALVMLLGFIARVWNLDFDQRQHLHPDERHWSLTSAELAADAGAPAHGTLAGPVLDWLDGDRSAANPYRVTESFVYGPAHLAATRAVAGWLAEGATTGDQPAAAVVHTLDWFGLPLLDATGAPRFDDGYQVDLIGRLLGAVYDTLTILVVALIGRRVGGRRAGLLAAGLYAASVMAIQHAHFFAAEPLLGLASACTVLAALHLGGGSARRVALLGAAAGVAAGATLAVKLSGAGVAAVPFAVAGWLLIRGRTRVDVVRLVAMTVGAVVAFRVLHPGAFEGLGLRLRPAFVDDIAASWRIDQLDFPPAVQWARRVPVLEPLRWLLVFTVGPGTSLLAIYGAWLLWGRRHGARLQAAVLGAAVLVPMAVAMRSFNPTGRYFVPAMPALHVVAGLGLAGLSGAAHLARVAGVCGGEVKQSDVERGRSAARLGRAAGAVLALVAVLWGAAFVQGVYGHAHTRVAASRWIAANVESGAVLTSQVWDDGLPLGLDGIDATNWPTEQLDLFAPDDVAKIDALAQTLTEVDYVVESSPRLLAAVPRIPARYPSTILFVEGLESGALGFEEVARFDSPPRLSLFGWEVMRLDDDWAEEAFSVYDHPEVRIWQRRDVLTLAEVRAVLQPWRAATAVAVPPQAAAANGTMLLPEEVAANEAAGTYADEFDVDANPWWHVAAWFVLLHLMGAVAFVVLLPLLRRLPDAGLGISLAMGLVLPAAAVFVAVAALDVAFTRSLVAVVLTAWTALGAWCAHRRRVELAELWHSRKRILASVCAVSAVAFVVLVALRAANPDLWHPYRSGEKPFETMLLTSVMRTRTLPPYDAWFAGGASNYYYGGYLLLSLPGRLLGTPPTMVMNIALGVVGAAAAAAVFSAGAALATVGRRRTARADDGSTLALRSGLLAVGLVLLLPNATILPEMLLRLVGARDGVYDWWATSRVIPRSLAVTEYPLWSLLFGDIHPHVLDLPIVVAVGVCCLAWHQQLLAGARRHAAALGLLVGVLVGYVRAANTWDYPLALTLALAAMGTAAVRTGSLRALTVPLGLAVVGERLVWAPYLWRSEVYDGGVEAVPMGTPVASWAQHWGLFAAATVVLFAVWVRPIVRRSPRLRGGLHQDLLLLAAAGLAVAGLVAMMPARGTQVLAATAAALAGTVAVGSVRWRHSRVCSPLGPAAMAAGWLFVAGVEQWSVRNDTERMNTVFKGWFQAWLLLAIGTAVALAGMLAAAHADHQRHRPSTAWHGVPRWGARLSAAVCVVAALASLAFLVLAVPVRLDDRASPPGPSLDGLAFYSGSLVVGEGPVQVALADDEPLIRWLQDHVRGVVTVAEAPGDDYQYTSRIASFVGLPTPIGWPYHERQQRRPYEPSIDIRLTDMRELYLSEDPGRVAELLRRYDVRVIVFGVSERRLVADQLVAEAVRRGEVLLAAPCVEEAFRSGDSFIATVDQACLSTGLP